MAVILDCLSDADSYVHRAASHRTWITRMRVQAITASGCTSIPNSAASDAGLRAARISEFKDTFRCGGWHSFGFIFVSESQDVPHAWILSHGVVILEGG